MRELAICIPIIRSDFIGRCLETFLKYTDNDRFHIFVMDQTLDDEAYLKYHKLTHLWVKCYRNLGFSKAANELASIAYRQGYPYIGILNDDTEAMHKDWWQGVLDEFATDEKILCVNPESPREPLWGYGREHGEVIDIIEYKEEYTDEDWEYLKAGNYGDNLKSRYKPEEIPDSFPLEKRGVVDAIAMWFPIFKREFFDLVGYFDERFYPGGGEDYDLNGRGYKLGYRLVSTMRAWVWHHWGQSKDRAAELDEKLNMFDPELRWNNLDELWPPDKSKGFSMDPWGHYKDPETDQKTPYYRVEEVTIKPL